MRMLAALGIVLLCGGLLADDIQAVRAGAAALVILLILRALK